MEQSFNERFKQLLRHYDLKSSEAARKMNVDRQVTDSYLKNAEPRLEMLIILLKSFPEISMRWLILGEGEMLNKNDNTVHESPPVYNTTSSDYKMLKLIWEQDRNELIKLRDQNQKLTEELLKITSEK